ncbi:MAG: hypothetical protein JW852_07675, partial [Spirochaetales bacterium]|nr:hypothetical protein [Spirochaetales bacterium]
MKSRVLLFLVSAALAAAFFSSCIVEITPVSGKVVNARDYFLDGVDGVTVTFKKADGSFEKTTVTASDGSYSMGYTGEGLYKVTARLGDDWFFIPQTVYVGGWLQSMPDILGI